MYCSRLDCGVKRNHYKECRNGGSTLCGPGGCFHGELLHEEWPKHGQKPFLGLVFLGVGVFFSLNLIRLCWEQVLWRNSAFSCGHSHRGRGVFFLLMIPQLGFPKLLSGTA